MKRKYIVLIEKGPESYGAYSPDIPGLGGAGNTAEEAWESFQEGLKLYMEEIESDGDEMPQVAHIDARTIEVEMPPATVKVARK